MATIEEPYMYFGKPDVLLHLAWRDGFVHYSENHIADLPKHYHFLKQMVDAGIAKISVMGTIGCQYTLLLNNDTEILKNTLSVIIEKLQCHKVVSPKILYWDTKKTWYFGGEISFALGRNKDWNLDAPNTGLDHDIECDYAPTCCMAIDNDVFNKIGFMDEDYFLYYDDTDFCMRLRNAGIKILVTPDTLLYHKVSSSTGKKQSFVRVYYLNPQCLFYIPLGGCWRGNNNSFV